jgi:integrase
MPKKRSIERDIEAFCGWDFLERLAGASSHYLDGEVISGLFLTGCRVSELLMLRRENFRLNVHPELVVVERAPVIKRYSRKLRKRYIAYRTFCFRRDEPLVPFLLKRLKNARAFLYPFTRQGIFYAVRRVGDIVNMPVPFSNIHSSQLYPHWFRAQRARQLKYDYGFSDEMLRDWFGWKFRSEGMPAIYGKYSYLEFARQMGVSL